MPPQTATALDNVRVVAKDRIDERTVQIHLEADNLRELTGPAVRAYVLTIAADAVGGNPGIGNEDGPFPVDAQGQPIGDDPAQPIGAFPVGGKFRTIFTVVAGL